VSTMGTNNAQQLFNWPADGVAQCDASALCDQQFADNNDHTRKCSTCATVIGANAVTCDECWHYCMGDTSP